MNDISPYDFKRIKGNENVLRHLRSAVKNGAVSHAYIFEAAPGMGKKTIANTFAKALQCESRTEPPCLACVSCRRFDSGNHPDVLYVAPAKTKSLGVDDIREQVNRPAQIKPYEYPYKIFVIDAADTMTPAAQNALLKTIEEPARYGVFLLLAANRENFLPTILSRCVTLPLRPLPDALVTDELVSRGIDTETARIAGAYARGNIGYALQLAQSDSFKTMRQTVLTMLRDLPAMSLDRVFSAISVFENYKEQIQEVLDLVTLWYRDVIVAKETGESRYLTLSDFGDDILKASVSMDFKALYHKLEAAQQAKLQLRQNGSFPLAMEVLLLKLR